MDVQAGDIINSSNLTSQTITSFSDQNPAYTRVIASEPDPTFRTSMNSADDIQDFFSRPIKLADYTWATGGTPFAHTFNPWEQYFGNPRVLNRITNYYLMRAKLHIKITINGNAYLQGRAIASYRPLKIYDNLGRTSFENSDLDMIAASQRPFIFLNPTTSEGGEMELPFFYYGNYLQVTLSEWKVMGEIWLAAINPMYHANIPDGETSVNVSVFAWATDVELSVPTQINVDTLLPQAGDEYATGPISRPASIVERAAGKLTSVPAIAPYARATQIAAGAAAHAAVAFGYSRPITVESANTVKLATTNVANTNVPENVYKLALDAKQELTVDSRTVGLDGTDEMDIRSIAMRQSYLTNFPWFLGNNPESRLFSIVVDPMMYGRKPISDEPGEVYLTPMAFAARPFRYWRGSLKYRFQVVANGFHRGRLKIVYDPVGNITTTAEYNTARTFVVDIAEQQDFSVTVGWGSRTSYRSRYIWTGDGDNECPMPPQAPYNAGSSMVSYNPYVGYGNGTLAVYVVNPLTGTTTNSDQVAVNVFVSACDDFEVAEPMGISYDNIGRIAVEGARMEVQAGDVVGNETSNEDHPESVTDHLMIPKLSPTDMTNHVFFGEAITSFRQLLKRYSYHSAHYVETATSGGYMYQFSSPVLPPWTTLIDGPSFVTRNRLTMLQYVMSAFLGWRGGLRWKIALSTGGSGGGLITNRPVVTGRIRRYTTEPSAQLIAVPADVAQFYSQNASSLQEGAAITTLLNEPVIEVELPYYSANRFSFARTNNPETSQQQSFYVQFPVRSSGVTILAQTYLSVGEDFSTFFFICAPTLYFVQP